jgi:hypothetical protein
MVQRLLIEYHLSDRHIRGTKSVAITKIIVDLRLVIGSKCRYEKNRCADAIVEAISLLTSFILLMALHFRYMFTRICLSLYRR